MITNEVGERSGFPKHFTRDIGRFLIWLFVLLFLISFFGNVRGVWNYAESSGYIYHDEMTTVYSPDWQSGEYKTCTTLNGSGQRNILCDGGVPSGRVEDGKLFMVRFWGRTYDEDAPHEGIGLNALPTLFFWNCRKNESGDPSITCHKTSAKQPSA